MKNKLLNYGFAVMAALAMASCSDSGSGSNRFSNLTATPGKLNLSGAKMLALASGSQTRAFGTREGAQTTISDPLYKVTGDGSIVSVDYTINITKKDKTDDDGKVVEEGFSKTLQRSFRLLMQYVYPIGDKYLWLLKCSLDGSLWNELPEGDEKGAIGRIIREHGIDVNYIVRKSDGAIFRWDNAPTEILTVRGDFMSPEDICGLVEPLGNDIVYVNNNRVITLLKTQGSSLIETTLCSTDKKAMFIAPTTDGYVGTVLVDDAVLRAHNFYGTGEICAITTSGQKITIGDYDRYGNDIQGYQDNAENQYRVRHGKEMFAAGGKLYTITRDADETTANFDLVKINGGTVSFENKAILPHEGSGYFAYHMHRGHTGLAYPVFGSETMSYIDGSEIYTFDPAKPTVSIVPLPAHYARSPQDYYDGVAYIMDGYTSDVSGQDPGYVFSGSLPAKIWICDMAKTEAEALNVDWNGLTAAQKAVTDYSALHWRYWGGAQCFKAKATLTDGSMVTYIIPVTGENKGKAELLSSADDLEVHALIKMKE